MHLQKQNKQQQKKPAQCAGHLGYLSVLQGKSSYENEGQERKKDTLVVHLFPQNKPTILL